jgi:hypothetical protein
MVKESKAPEPAEPSGEEVQAALEELLAVITPLTGNVVDLDLFAGGEVLYRIKDVRGKERKYPLPADPPFEPVLAFFLAHDAWELAAERLGEAKGLVDRAKGPAEIARLRAREQARLQEWIEAWGKCIDTFLPLVRILTPKATREDLSPGLGQSALENFMRVAIFRFNKGRIEQVLQAVEATPPKEPDNRAERRRTSRSKSASSS